ncbi:protein tipD, putative [Entamoeba invadens IP1]|uniref:protein tipD, putative n=1 Tax=Entamoeba invadens IP1 TaxID=370355 RepID=UPI0002C3E6A3|nr:protein tipD, putative [Entamoeba invadens IP1]ELP94091.1 protein tipD, putative [Entamoeba invadens IP1]|eukprot:XP_004260862.1 protein tipD, putative [Entamoeba invadens IP1]
MSYASLLFTKLERRDLIQIAPWKSITSITLTTASKEEYDVQVSQLSKDLLNSTTFINAQTARLFEAADKISELQTIIKTKDGTIQETKDLLATYQMKAKDEDTSKKSLEKQIEYLKKELAFSRQSFEQTSEKSKAVNYENHRLLDIIEDLRKQVERNSTQSYIQTSTHTNQLQKHESSLINKSEPPKPKPELQKQKTEKLEKPKTPEKSDKNLKVSKTETFIAKEEDLKPTMSIFKGDFACKVPSIAVRNIVGHTGDITCLAFSANGQLYASGSEDRTVRIYDSGLSVCKMFLRGMAQSVTSVTFSEVSDMLLVTSNDATSRVFDLQRNSTRYTLTGHANRVTGGKFLDALSVVTGSSDRTVRFWDLSQSRCKLSCSAKSAVISLELMRNQIVTCHMDGTLRFWDNRQKEDVGIIEVYDGVACSGVTFVEGVGEYLLVNGKDNVVWMVDPLMMRKVKSFVNDDYINPGSKIGVSCDKQFMTVGSVDGSVFVWNLLDGKFAKRIYPDVNVGSSTDKSCYCAMWNPLTSQMISGYGKNVVVWDE